MELHKAYPKRQTTEKTCQLDIRTTPTTRTISRLLPSHRTFGTGGIVIQKARHTHSRSSCIAPRPKRTCQSTAQQRSARPTNDNYLRTRHHNSKCPSCRCRSRTAHFQQRGNHPNRWPCRAFRTTSIRRFRPLSSWHHICNGRSEKRNHSVE